MLLIGNKRDVPVSNRQVRRQEIGAPQHVVRAPAEYNLYTIDKRQQLEAGSLIMNDTETELPPQK